MQVFSTRTYERAIRKLLGEEARKEMEESIVADPGADRLSFGVPAVSASCDGPDRDAGSDCGGSAPSYFYHAGRPGAALTCRDGLRESGPRRPHAGGHEGVVASGRRDQEGDNGTMTAERTGLGLEIETALGEVLGHVRGETVLPCRIVDAPRRRPDCGAAQAVPIEPAEQFAERWRPRRAALQEWEQGRRVPDHDCAGVAHRHRPGARGRGQGARRRGK